MLGSVLGTVVAATAILLCLVASQFLWGRAPSRTRVVLSTFTGISAALTCWILVASFFPLVDTDTTGLGVWLLIVTVMVASLGRRRVERSAA